MRVIGYTRVSTQSQAESGLGLAAQRASITAHANANGWEVDWLSDEGLSAKSLDRPALQEAFARLKRHEAQAIVVAKLDRLSRSLQDFAGVLVVAKKQHWSVIAIDLGVDTTTSAGRLMANVMASVAEWERDVIGERTSAAMQAARANGVHIGRPSTLPKATESRLIELRASGLSHSRIAQRLNTEAVPTAHGGSTWHPSTVARILKRTEAAA